QQRDSLLRPDLAVGMRIAAAHHFTLVFEYLDMVDVRPPSEIAMLLHPGFNHSKDLVHRHLREAQVVPRRKAKNPADATLGHRLQNSRSLGARCFSAIDD